MQELFPIDTTYTFIEEYFHDIDPDGQNPTLCHWHKTLWEKELPFNKGYFSLKKKRRNYNFLYHNSELGEFSLTSDAIINEYYDYTSKGRHKDMQEIILHFSKDEIDLFLGKITTIGGYIIFPIGKKGWSLNQARGCNRKILDRFDLTLECIRLYYEDKINTELNPLYTYISCYEDFFNLFTNFRGYCEFFLLQDLVSDDYSKIKFFLPFDGFVRNPKPTSIEEYNIFMNRCTDFIGQRNNRIKQYIENI